jgi:hypothetical protein
MNRDDRIPDEAWLMEARPLFLSGREILASISYLYNTPNMNFAMPRSLDELRKVIDACPDGAELTLWPEASLPFRGYLTEALLDSARASIPDSAESLCLFIDSSSESDPRLEGDSWHLAKYMYGELRERMGERVAIGQWPSATGSMIAIKGGVHGPR